MNRHKRYPPEVRERADPWEIEGFIERIERALGRPPSKKNRGQDNGKIIKSIVSPELRVYPW